MRLKKTWGKTTARGQTNSWKTWPEWNKGKLLLYKIVQGNKCLKKLMKNKRYWTNGLNTTLSCTITRPRVIYQKSSWHNKLHTEVPKHGVQLLEWQVSLNLYVWQQILQVWRNGCSCYFLNQYWVTPRVVAEECWQTKHDQFQPSGWPGSNNLLWRHTTTTWFHQTEPDTGVNTTNRECIISLNIKLNQSYHWPNHNSR